MMSDRRGDFRINQLAGAGIFQNFGRPILAELAATAAHRSFRKNATVIHQGDTPSYIYVIVHGTVRLSLPLSDGREFIFSDLGPGEVFDVSSLFTAQQSRMNAVSMTESDMLQIEIACVASLLERHANLAMELIPYFCQAVHDAQERLIDSTASLLPTRLASTLLRITKDPHGIEVSDYEPQAIRLSQTDIAAMVPASREKVNRCLQEWQRRQIVQCEQRMLTILDRECLESIALGCRPAPLCTNGV
jgi:CRP/FNR family cyclic AMP-dependent transcriptional regulator